MPSVVEIDDVVRPAEGGPVLRVDLDKAVLDFSPISATMRKKRERERSGSASTHPSSASHRSFIEYGTNRGAIWSCSKPRAALSSMPSAGKKPPGQIVFMLFLIREMSSPRPDERA